MGTVRSDRGRHRQVSHARKGPGGIIVTIALGIIGAVGGGFLRAQAEGSSALRTGTPRAIPLLVLLAAVQSTEVAKARSVAHSGRCGRRTERFETNLRRGVRPQRATNVVLSAIVDGTVASNDVFTRCDVLEHSRPDIRHFADEPAPAVRVAIVPEDWSSGWQRVAPAWSASRASVRLMPEVCTPTWPVTLHQATCRRPPAPDGPPGPAIG